MSGFNQQGQAPRHAAVQRVAGMGFDGASDRPTGSGHGSQSGASQRGGSNQGSPSRTSQAGRSGSQSGSPPPPGTRSRAGSISGGPAKSNPFPKGLGHDPAIDPNDPQSSRAPGLSDTELVGKRIDLPADAFQSVSVF
jgi:hypothetical protein